MSDWCFDWFESTIHGSGADEVAATLLRASDLTDLAPGKGMYGYQRGALIRRGSRVLASIWHGGQPGVHVSGTGEDSTWVRNALLQFDQRVTRVDSRMDWVEPGLFNRLSATLIDYALEHGIKMHQEGDWARGEARTLYLGSPKSTARLVLYEKGFQMGGDPAWVRLEVRLRPKGDAGYRVAYLSPEDIAGCSPWITKALAACDLDVIRHRSVGSVWRPSDEERARLALVRQYRNVISAWADEVGGWESLGSSIREKCDEIANEVPF